MYIRICIYILWTEVTYYKVDGLKTHVYKAAFVLMIMSLDGSF